MKFAGKCMVLSSIIWNDLDTERQNSGVLYHMQTILIRGYLSGYRLWEKIGGGKKMLRKVSGEKRAMWYEREKEAAKGMDGDKDGMVLCNISLRFVTLAYAVKYLFNDAD